MADNTTVDPVCGMKLDPAQAKFTSDYDGMRYYFCSENCKHRFDHDPEVYLHSDLAATDVSE